MPAIEASAALISFGGRRAVEDAQEQLLDELGVVRISLRELGDGVVRIADRVADRRAADERHDRAELHVVAAFAFAGALARGPAEVAEEAVGQLDLRVGELRGAGAGFARRESCSTAPVTA